jgi:Flp pilus assembly protein TadD
METLIMMNAEARYLRGAELAQAGQYEQAATELRAAVQLQPTLYTAHFQLGLLILTLGKSAEALVAWRPLEQLDDGNALKLFKRGMEALIRDEFNTSIQLLTDGIAANDANPPLNKDMRLVIERAREARDNPVRTDFSLYQQ